MEHENKGLTAIPHQRPAWMTADWLAAAARYTNGPVAPMAREILHLDDAIPALAAERDTARAEVHNANDAAAKAFAEVEQLRAELDAAIRSVDLAKQSIATYEADARRACDERDAAIRDRNGERENFNLLSQRCAGAEAARDKAQRERAEAHNFIQGFATAITGRECPPVDSTNIHRVADEVLVPFLRDRNEFAATEIERIVRPFVNVTEGLADRAKHRAAELRSGAVPPAICTTPPADLHQSPADLHQSPEPRRVKLPFRFRELVAMLREDDYAMVSEALSLLGEAIESVEVR
jgi:hypothetical protein